MNSTKVGEGDEWLGEALFRLYLQCKEMPKDAVFVVGPKTFEDVVRKIDPNWYKRYTFLYCMGIPVVAKEVTEEWTGRKCGRRS